MGVRIIGNVTRFNGREREAREAAPGRNVVITGPSGTATITTDKQGIYDLTGLPSGRYEIHSEIRSLAVHSSGIPNVGVMKNSSRAMRATNRKLERNKFCRRCLRVLRVLYESAETRAKTRTRFEIKADVTTLLVSDFQSVQTVRLCNSVPA